MNRIHLPALTGHSPLGVLAALGVIRLLEEHTDDSPLLAWSPEGLTAELTTSRQSIEEIVADLQAVVDAIPQDGVLPGVEPNFPPPGEAPDRLRLPRSELRGYAGTLPDGAAVTWLASLITDLALDDSGRSALSLYAAPSGKQSTRTMLEKPLALIRQQPDLLNEALVHWRRYQGVTGEYLDHRAAFDAAESSDGKTGQMRGVPGATWLALMAYPLFRTTAIGDRPITSGWHRVSTGVATGRARRIRQELILPVWEPPLDCEAVRTLIEHPLLDEVASSEPGDTLTPKGRALGIIHVCRAERRQQPGGKSAGVLTVLR